MTPSELFHRLYDAWNRGDLDEAAGAYHPDYVEDYPQSGERIRGPANVRAIVENYPGGIGQLASKPQFFGEPEQWVVSPSYIVVRVTTSGDTGAGVLKVRYGDQSEWWMVALFELKDGLLYRQQAFFAEPFDPPEWRAQWVERTSD